jgi:hypothetical protein
LVIRNKLEHQEKENSKDGRINAVLTDTINVTLESFNVIRFEICHYLGLQPFYDKITLPKLGCTVD